MCVGATLAMFFRAKQRVMQGWKPLPRRVTTGDHFLRAVPVAASASSAAALAVPRQLFLETILHEARVVPRSTADAAEAFVAPVGILPER